MYQGEKFNSITHLVGAILALPAFIVLLVFASRQGDTYKIVSFSVYGVTLFVMYAFSTLYHSLRGRAKHIFKKLDHIAIYLLIAGTYTPFTLVTLNGAWGWSIFGAVWALAVAGIVVDALHRSGLRIAQMAIYFTMGWCIIVALVPLVQRLPAGGIAWLVAGGVSYTGGIVFYAVDDKLRHAHGIWHLFVLGGSVSHYLAIALYLL